jgi:hypothetical protein
LVVATKVDVAEKNHLVGCHQNPYHHDLDFCLLALLARLACVAFPFSSVFSIIWAETTSQSVPWRSTVQKSPNILRDYSSYLL